MPNFLMMRCTFLRLILTFCPRARQSTICRDPFLEPCEAKAASTCSFAARSAFSRSRRAATQSQQPRLETSRAPQAALTLKDGVLLPELEDQPEPFRLLRRPGCTLGPPCQRAKSF